MNLTLDQPELVHYINGLVNSGRFATPEAVVADALLRAMNEDAVLTDEDVTAIEVAGRQLDSGQRIDSKEVAAQMREIYGKSRP